MQSRLFKTINFAFRPPAWLDADIAKGIATHAGDVEEAVSGVIKRAMELRESGKYSPPGLRDELQALAVSADKELTSMEAQARTGLTSFITAAEAKMHPKATAQSEAAVLRQLQHQEIRAYAVSLKDPLELDNYYRQAVKEGNDLVADAIEGDPTRRLKFANANLVKELRHERLSHRYPEEAATHRAYSHVWTEVQTAYRYGRKALEAAGLALPSKDPLAA